MMHSYPELWAGRVSATEMHMEIERNRLESRLAEARRANEVSSEAFSEELSPLRREMAARTIAVVTALFR